MTAATLAPKERFLADSEICCPEIVVSKIEPHTAVQTDARAFVIFTIIYK